MRRSPAFGNGCGRRHVVPEARIISGGCSQEHPPETVLRVRSLSVSARNTRGRMFVCCGVLGRRCFTRRFRACNAFGGKKSRSGLPLRTRSPVGGRIGEFRSGTFLSGLCPDCCPASVSDGPICRENSFCGGKAAAFPYSFPRGRSENSKKIEIFLCLPSGSLCPVLGRSFQEGYRGGFRDRVGAATDPSFFRPEENSRIGLPQRIAFRFSCIVRIDPGNYVLIINMLVFSVVF